MLVLTRRPGEKIIIGEDIHIMVLGMKGGKEGGQVRIGIDAPKDLSVHREEIYDKIQKDKFDSNNTNEETEKLTNVRTKERRFTS